MEHPEDLYMGYKYTVGAMNRRSKIKYWNPTWAITESYLVSISFFNFLILWYSTKIENIVTSADGKTLKDAVSCLNIEP